MSATPATLGDNRFTLGGILILAFLIGWLSGLKNLVLDQTATAESEDNLTRPNILLIVADDLGYNDTDAINPGGLHTPNITALARDGVTARRAGRSFRSGLCDGHEWGAGASGFVWPGWAAR